MIVRLSLLVVTAFAAIAALAHAQHPPTASFDVVDDRYVREPGGGTSATIALGGKVSFFYSVGEENHGVHVWRAGPQCTVLPGADPVPSGRVMPAVAEGPGWSGECRFDTAGIYAFYCDDHSDMTGKVTVANADGTLPSEGP